MRRLGLLPLFLLAALTLPAENVKDLPAPTGYVDDFALVLTPEGQSRIESICTDVHRQAHAQIFFVTIHNHGDEPVETFANELFAKWKIGEKGTDRGLLILLSIDDHKRWIETGYGFEGILPDARVGDIGASMTTALKAGDYDTAGQQVVQQFATIIAADANVTLTPPPDATPVPPQDAKPPIGLILILFFAAVFVIFFLIAWALKRIRNGPAISSFYDPSDSSSYPIGGSSPPYFASTDTSSSSSSASGSSSSDASSSSDSSSSSSDSSSDFSGGDGGTSGGGGAGGDW